MPGKRKKERKSGKTNKAAPKSRAPDYSSRNASKPSPTGGPKAQTKRFTLKDEAAKSTMRSSKRLWQGEGQKLRNSPVEFVKAVDKYDPGQFLRDQIEANAKKQAGIEAHDSPETRSQLANEPEMNRPDIVQTDPEELSIDFEESLVTDLSPEDITSSIPHAAVEDPHLSSPSVSRDNDNDVTLAVDGLRIDSPERASPPAKNVDFILDQLATEEEDEEESEEGVLVLSADDNDEEILNSFDDEDDQGDEETQTATDADLFVVDTEGNTDIRPSSSVSETIMLQPRSANTVVQPLVEADTTPWARTIDDPKSMVPQSSNFAGGHAFEDHASSNRGRRGGRKKQEKINAANNTRRQDDIDIMFDYMENARWTDEEDEEEEEVESFITQLLSQPGGIDFGDQEVPDLKEDEEGEEDEDTTLEDEEESEDDTDIDDDLELMIDAEMEEMEFDLGYSGGRSSKGRRYGADREMVDHALYHEDFNVYQYNSEDEEEEEIALGASGARQRGLNKFVDSLDLSDEELEAALIAQWKKDRGSKKEKKRQRQKLHQQGLIGKKAKRARASHEVDTRSYGDLDAYHTHIKRFVSHADYAGIEEMPMPAMDKAVRRAVHVLIQAYGLKSASQGSGKRRHIILYKTKHAAQLPDADFLEETLFRARRSLGFNTKHRDTLLPDAARQKLGRSGKPMRSGRDGGGGGGRLRDGDLVGADAPEIHVANRGRQMLEKLGWLHGSGLGAVGKEGINLPLFATIKNSKHGLQ